MASVANYDDLGEPHDLLSHLTTGGSAAASWTGSFSRMMVGRHPAPLSPTLREGSGSVTISGVTLIKAVDT